MGRAAPKTRRNGPKKVGTWLGPATQQLRRLLPRVARELGRTVSLSSLRRIVRRLGYGWKRLRRGLKARRDAVLFAFFQQELTLLHHAEARGELAVVYADECRFSRHAPVPYAWQRRGQPPVVLPAEGATPCWACGRLRPRTSPCSATYSAGHSRRTCSPPSSTSSASTCPGPRCSCSTTSASTAPPAYKPAGPTGPAPTVFARLLPRTQQNRAALAPLQTLLVDARRLRNHFA